MSQLWSWAQCEAALQKLFERLDWASLGKRYFHEDGEERWAALAPRVLLLGMDWARAACKRLPERGVSLYAGAGVAELPALFAERFVRGRRVVAANRSGSECDAVNDAIRKIGLCGEIALRQGDAAEFARQERYGHLGCVSLFTDPETWPLLSGVAYGRIAPVQLDVEAFVQERAQARALAETLMSGLETPGWITTSVEEAAWFVEQAGRKGLQVEADDQTLPTAVVGDPIGFLKIR
jgi:hypothetical protein